MGETTEERDQEKRSENAGKGHPERKAVAGCLGSPYIVQGKLYTPENRRMRACSGAGRAKREKKRDEVPRSESRDRIMADIAEEGGVVEAEEVDRIP